MMNENNERVSEETIVWFMEQAAALLQKSDEALPSSSSFILDLLRRSSGSDLPSRKSEITHEDDHIMVLIPPGTPGATLVALGSMTERAHFPNVQIISFGSLFGVWTAVQCCCHAVDTEEGHDLDETKEPEAPSNLSADLSPDSVQAGEDFVEFIRKFQASRHNKH